MPQFKSDDYVPFFGDGLADSIRQDATGADVTRLVYSQLHDLAELQSGITGITRILNKSQAHLGLTPQQFAARQNVLTAARAVLVSERNKLMETAYNEWTAARARI